MYKLHLNLFVLTFGIFAKSVSAAEITTFEDCYATFENDVLIVGNQGIERSWRWTGKGFATQSLIDKANGKSWSSASKFEADWELPGDRELTEAKLISVDAQASDDEGFVDEHLEVVATVSYPESLLDVKYRIWVFPGLSGMRTQIFYRVGEGFKAAPRETRFGMPKDKWAVLSNPPTLYDDAPTTGGTPKKQYLKPEYLIDNQLGTLWLSTASEVRTGKPHEIVIDLGSSQDLDAIGVWPPLSYRRHGAPETVIVLLSDDRQAWSRPVAVIPVKRSNREFVASVDGAEARYLKLVMPQTSHVNTNNWSTSLAEINVYTKEYPYEAYTSRRTDYLPLESPDQLTRRGMGYFMDMQFRNYVDAEYYREVETSSSIGEQEVWDWVNMMDFTDSDGNGLLLVKESHKTAIEPGHFTGDYQVDSRGVSMTGLGLRESELRDEFRESWANWIILYSGDKDVRSLALKKFDRARFPTKLPGHRSVNACTWGGGSSPATNRALASESNVIAELNSLADLGVETLLIDDGWQLAPHETNSLPDSERGWKPNVERYTNGDWEKVLEASRKTGVDLALWTAIQRISDEDLRWNQDRVPFKHWKFDFVNVRDYDTKNLVETRAREFIKEYDFKVSAEWDLTESTPRYGLFWAREYGYIWLANRRKGGGFPHVSYQPAPMLKVVWDLARNLNTNKFQIVSVDVDQVPSISDASLHPMEYAFAISMVGIPMLFDSTKSFSSSTRDAVSRMVSIYKPHQDAMVDSYVFPIGEQPTNAGVSGFQFYNPDSNEGYLLIFRELHCAKTEFSLQLKFLKGMDLEVVDLRKERSSILKVNDSGYASFQIDNPADFLFLKYKI